MQDFSKLKGIKAKDLTPEEQKQAEDVEAAAPVVDCDPDTATAIFIPKKKEQRRAGQGLGITDTTADPVESADHKAAESEGRDQGAPAKLYADVLAFEERVLARTTIQKGGPGSGRYGHVGTPHIGAEGGQIGRSVRVFGVRPYQPSARRVYQPAALP
jgi:hypothetical protein